MQIDDEASRPLSHPADRADGTQTQPGTSTSGDIVGEVSVSTSIYLFTYPPTLHHPVASLHCVLE